MAPEGSQNEYRFFAEAAKESGIEDKDTRKIIAEDPSLFMDEMSPELQRKLTAKNLSDLFEVLAGKGEGIDHSSLVTIGNVLYDYRPQANNEDPALEQLSIEEKDRKKIDLAYILVENAVYEKRLTSLSKEQTAALAFMVNTMGKLFLEGKAEGLRGFDQEKFDQFVGRVEEFEVRDLSGEEYIKGDQITSIENKKLQLEDEIKKVGAELERLLPLIDSEVKEIIDRLSSALDIIKDSGILSSDQSLRLPFKYARELVTLLTYKQGQHSKTISKFYEKIIKQTIELLEKGSTGREIPFIPENKEVVNYLAIPFEKSPNDVESDEFGIKSDVEAVSRLATRLKLHIPKEENNGTKKLQTLKGFGELATVTAQSRLPEALSILEELLAKQGIFNDIMKEVERAKRLQRNKENLTLQHQYFQNSARMVREGKGSGAIAYAIKTLLIAGDMIEGQYDNGAGIACLKIPGHDFKSNYLRPQVHSFLKTPNRDYSNPGYDYGPAYANLHFIPAHIPFLYSHRGILNQIKYKLS